MDKQQQQQQPSTIWQRIVDLMSDDNPQNQNAANAGDGPKHTVWLCLLRSMAKELDTVVETHAGGGIYRVRAADSFCIGLPSRSIIGQHQRSARLPVAPVGPVGQVYYSASGDQVLLNTRPQCRYVAFDQNLRTRQRLRAVAELRGRPESLQSHGPFAGTEGGSSVREILSHCDPTRTLVMCDPFTQEDLAVALQMIEPEFPAVFFGARPRDARPQAQQQFDAVWSDLLARYRERGIGTIQWTWRGAPAAGEEMRQFRLLVQPGGSRDEAERRLHQLMFQCHRESHWHDVIGRDGFSYEQMELVIA